MSLLYSVIAPRQCKTLLKLVQSDSAYLLSNATPRVDIVDGANMGSSRRYAWSEPCRRTSVQQRVAQCAAHNQGTTREGSATSSALCSMFRKELPIDCTNTLLRLPASQQGHQGRVLLIASSTSRIHGSGGTAREQFIDFRIVNLGGSPCAADQTRLSELVAGNAQSTAACVVTASVSASNKSEAAALAPVGSGATVARVQHRTLY